MELIRQKIHQQRCACLTLKSDKAKEEMKKKWQNKVQKGELTFQLLPQNQPEKQKLILGNLPEECKTSIIQAYLEKYVIDPQVTIIIDVGEWGAVETCEAEVTHKGLKKILPRKV